MKKSAPLFFLLLLMGGAIFAFLFWPMNNPQEPDTSKPNPAVVTKKKIIPLTTQRTKSSEKKTPKIVKTATPKDHTKEKQVKKTHLTEVNFQTCLPNGKPFHMPVVVEQNGQTYDGQGIYGHNRTFKLAPGEATAYCILRDINLDVGQGESDRKTFTVERAEKQNVKLVLRDGPGYSINFNRPYPKFVGPIFTSVIYDKSGTMTKQQAQEKSLLGASYDRTTIIKGGVKPGRYFALASSHPYNIEIVHEFSVGSTFETLTLDFPKLSEEKAWRFIRLTDSDRNPVTNAQFTVSHLVYGSKYESSPKSVHLGEGLYKIWVPLTKKPRKRYQSSLLLIKVNDQLVAVTPFKLDQKEIAVQIKGKGSLLLHYDLSGIKKEMLFVTLVAPHKEFWLGNPKATQMTDLLAGQYILKLGVDQFVFVSGKKRRRRAALILEKAIELKPGDNHIRLDLKFYERVIQTNMPNIFVWVNRTDALGKDWLAITDAQGFAKFSNLPAGQYKLTSRDLKKDISFKVP